MLTPPYVWREWYCFLLPLICWSPVSWPPVRGPSLAGFLLIEDQCMTTMYSRNIRVMVGIRITVGFDDERLADGAHDLGD